MRKGDKGEKITPDKDSRGVKGQQNAPGLNKRGSQRGAKGDQSWRDCRRHPIILDQRVPDTSGMGLSNCYMLC